MDKRKGTKLINQDPLRWARNTVRLPYEGEPQGGLSERYGFFTCIYCDLPQGTSGMLLQANISHYCDDCGQPLIMWIRL